jgi:hypothetical protein
MPQIHTYLMVYRMQQTYFYLGNPRGFAYLLISSQVSRRQAAA